MCTGMPRSDSPVKTRVRVQIGRLRTVALRADRRIRHHIVLPPLSTLWHTLSMDATLVLGKQGRLVIPADIRAALGLEAGDRLHLHADGSVLFLERPVDALSDLRALARDVPNSRSLVDELLQERRAAAANE